MISREDDRNPLAVHLGGTIRRRRVRLGISQEDLAGRTSLHRTEVGMIERGRRQPRLGTIIKLAGALEVMPESLFAGIDWKVAEKSFAIEERDDEQGK
jgi:transcriptional regulator with XRE-family HTH domain